LVVFLSWSRNGTHEASVSANPGGSAGARADLSRSQPYALPRGEGWGEGQAEANLTNISVTAVRSEVGAGCKSAVH
jgi:hypothetical protein